MQPEPLYYILIFLAILLGVKILRGAPWWLYVTFGLICGLAYLAKPSLAPFLVVFCLAFALRASLTRLNGDENWNIRRNLAGLMMALGICAVLLVPLAAFSKTYFGTPLFNYTKYWIWMDDFMTEAWPFQDKYPGRVQLEQLPHQERPSLSWYFQRHGVGDAAQRLGAGTWEVFIRFLFPEKKLPLSGFFSRPSAKKWEQPLTHRGVYLLLLTGLSVSLLVVSRSPLPEIFTRPGDFACLLFAVMIAIVYLLLYGWSWPIGRGDRFMGSLWIPSIFGLCWLAFALRRYAANRFADTAYLSVHGAILILLVLQVATMLWRFSAGIYLVTRN